MQFPHSHLGTILSRPTEIGRMLEELRTRTGAGLIAFNKHISTGRALAEIGRSPITSTERKDHD